MRKSLSGFTLVELLIVIVVIGILASITVVAYSGVQTKALNTARYTEMKQWQKLLSFYVAKNGQLPDVTAGNYCLGSGFPSGKCRDYQANNANTYSEAGNQTLMNSLKTISDLPNGPRNPTNGTVGPYINIWSSGYTMTDVFKGGANNCPSETDYSWDDGAGRLLCTVTVQYY